MTVAECYKILRLDKNAGLEDLKKAFRTLAFELHPDLNPDNPHAARQFQRVNEAYVLLRQTLADEPPAGTKGKARATKAKGAKTYREQAAKGPKNKTKTKPPPKAKAGPKRAKVYYKSEDVLRDILSDPFARKVYEDIYSRIRNGGGAMNAPRVMRRRKATLRFGDKEIGLDLSRGLGGAVKGWMKNQMDDEQTIYLEPAQLLPGNIIRLQVSRPWSGKPVSVEVPLPPDYVIGRALRLKGLGRRIGPFKGDLYLRLMAK